MTYFQNEKSFVLSTKFKSIRVDKLMVGDIILDDNYQEKRITEINKKNTNCIEHKISHSLSLISDNNFETLFFDSKSKARFNFYRKLRSGYKLDFAKVQNVIATKVINQTIKSELTKDQCYLLGLFSAEGSFGKRKGEYRNVIFSFSAKEQDTLGIKTQQLLQNIFEVKSSNISSPSQPTKSTVAASSNKEVANWFLKMCGEYSLHKTLHKNLLFSTPENKISFLKGWIDGDGSVDKQSGKLEIVTVSPHLAFQARIMLDSLGINNCVYYDYRKPNGKIIGGYTFRVKVPYNEAITLIHDSSKFVDLDVKYVKRNYFIDENKINKVLKQNDIQDQPTTEIILEDNSSYFVNSFLIKPVNKADQLSIF